MLLSEFGRFGVDPFAEVRRMQERMNRLFTGATEATFPPINLWQGDDKVALTAELPGVEPNDVDVTVQDNVLVLKGKREPKWGQDADWQRQERPYGSFSRIIELPFRVDADRVNARFENGVLELELERPEADKPRKLQIRAS